VRRDSPEDQWVEIVRTAWLVRSYKQPEGIEGRLADGEPLTGGDVNYVVNTCSDARILARLVQELSEHAGALEETTYGDLPGPWR
jgi:hypothetical protein